MTPFATSGTEGILHPRPASARTAPLCPSCPSRSVIARNMYPLLLLPSPPSRQALPSSHQVFMLSIVLALTKKISDEPVPLSWRVRRRGVSWGYLFTARTAPSVRLFCPPFHFRLFVRCPMYVHGTACSPRGSSGLRAGLMARLPPATEMPLSPHPRLYVCALSRLSSW